jgi:uncharacterized membrane protein YgaE (UPF0421/DUF939 family)
MNPFLGLAWLVRILIAVAVVVVTAKICAKNGWSLTFGVVLGVVLQPIGAIVGHILAPICLPFFIGTLLPIVVALLLPETERGRELREERNSVDQGMANSSRTAACPVCQRRNSVTTRVCPQCETKLISW